MSTTTPRPEPRATQPGAGGTPLPGNASSPGDALVSGAHTGQPRQPGSELNAVTAAHAPQRRTGRLLSHLLVLLAGLGVTIWGAVRLTHRTIKCHGVVMHPGDSCRTSSFSQLNGDKLMSYELLRRQAEISQPFVIGAGLLLAAFGGLLLWQELRRSRAR